MLYKLDNNIIKMLDSDYIEFSKATTNQIDDIFNLYIERVNWFKENKIQQWGKYLEHHTKEEFSYIVENGNYFILQKNNNIIAGFELSRDSKYWKDENTNALYIYKLVVKVGYKDIGKYIFYIIDEISKLNNINVLRLDCLKENQKLNDIYESHGFKLIKTGYEKYYGSYSLREKLL